MFVYCYLFIYLFIYYFLFAYNIYIYAYTCVCMCIYNIIYIYYVSVLYIPPNCCTTFCCLPSISPIDICLKISQKKQAKQVNESPTWTWGIKNVPPSFIYPLVIKHWLAGKSLITAALMGKSSKMAEDPLPLIITGLNNQQKVLPIPAHPIRSLHPSKRSWFRGTPSWSSMCHASCRRVSWSIWGRSIACGRHGGSDDENGGQRNVERSSKIKLKWKNKWEKIGFGDVSEVACGDIHKSFNYISK